MKNNHTAGQKLPETLTLLVTGTGQRTNETKDVLLIRTDDATIHLSKEFGFGKLAHALVDRYNKFESMHEALKQFIHSVEHEGVINGRVVDAVRNAKEAINKATN